MVHTRHETGDHRFTGAGIAGKHHVQRHIRVRQTVFAAHLINHCHVDEVFHLFLHCGKSYVACKLLFKLLHRFLRRQFLLFFGSLPAISAIGCLCLRRFHGIGSTARRSLRILYRGGVLRPLPGQSRVLRIRLRILRLGILRIPGCAPYIVG